jgi:hypothetical protein
MPFLRTYVTPWEEETLQAAGCTQKPVAAGFGQDGTRFIVLIGRVFSRAPDFHHAVLMLQRRDAMIRQVAP